ncbi:ComF family protein [Salinisphaera hydrothermalis]|uniref:ComF family protein n=1 Tax=Salinisphaera hydrothermalis TaxID=563188 RepID=UPI0033415CC0
MTLFLYDWAKNIQNAWLAPRCPVCAAAIDAAAPLCAGCHADLPVLETQCRHCAIALSESAATRVCADCARRPRFDHALAGFHYRQPIAWMIGGLKYHRHLAHARILGDLLAERIALQAPEPPDLLAAVPLHPAAFRRRGFNQAERIAIRLADRLDWRVERDVFARVRDTPHQSTLDAAQRAANVRDAFAARCDLAGRHVAIVDDVMTTARTASALARTARTAGAARVDVYCVARA